MQQTSMTLRSRPRLEGYLVLGVGSVALASAALLIRMAQGEGMPSLMIVASRLALASLMVAPFSLRAGMAPLQRLGGRTWMWLVLAGLLLTLHFVCWVSSLEYTTIMIGITLVNTSPLWVSIFEIVFLKARLSHGVAAGLAVALIGSIALGLSGRLGQGVGSNPLLGAALAATGAVTVAMYLVIGRNLRNEIPFGSYIFFVYAVAAIGGAAIMLATRIPLYGYPAMGYLWILLLAIVPQGIGHSASNLAVRYFPATYVSVANQIVPILTTALAFVFFGEVPTPTQALMGVIIIVGVVIATLAQSSQAITRVS